MNETPDISLFSLLLCFLLLALPAAVSYILNLRLIKPLFIAAIRMAAQLFLAGLYLEYLFDLNNPYVTMAWFTAMIAFAALTVIKSSGLYWKIFIIPSTFALIVVTIPILMYFNLFIIRLDNIFEAKFVIAVGGMVLGNAMRAIIVGVSDFYKSIKRDANRWLYSLSLGATIYEAASIYVRRSLNAALQPTMASMASMGIVFLPGMLTGQIIGGLDPLFAIKYQIAIMIVIYVSTMLCIGLSILLTIRNGFDEFGILKKEVFARTD